MIPEKERRKMYDPLQCVIFEFRSFISHSANQFSIYGAAASCSQLISGQTHVSVEKLVAKVNYQLSHKLEPQEVDSSVQTPRSSVKPVAYLSSRI